jgi:hypothetical protein
MKLFTKDINQKLFAQYRIGSNLNEQNVVAKIFNPYGIGRWYLLNSDPNDPDYLWAIVQMGDVVEVGSVLRSELETIRVKPFGLPLERDMYFSDRNAMEVLDGLEKGKTFAHGGMTAGRYYKDNSGNEFRFIGESEGKLLFKDGEKIVTKSEEDFEDAPKEKKLFGIFAEGGETAAAEHNIKQAKYGARLVGKQKNLDVNKNGKLDADDFKMLRGEKMAMGGNTQKAFEVILQNPNGKMNKRAVLLAKTKEDASKKALNLEEYKQYGYVVKSAEEIKYAMGGKVKFEDKVKAVQKSLLKRKKVAPVVQKDYGKTYNRKEALESAKRIIGAQTAKWEKRNKK